MTPIRYSETYNHLVLVVNKGAMGIPVKDFVAEAYTRLDMTSETTDSLAETQRININSLIRELNAEGNLDETNNLIEDRSEAVRDDMYYLDMITFELEETLYLVPKGGFIKETDAFSVLLKNIDTSQRGHDSYLKLEGVNAADFKALLSYMCLRNQTFTREEWISIMRLATEWKMLDIRATAILKLPTTQMDPASQVKFGREFKVASWVKSGFSELAERHESISKEDLEKIGFDSAVKLCNLREGEHDQAWESYISRLSLDAHTKTAGLMPKLITEVFADTINQGSDPLEQLLLAKENNLIGSFKHAFNELCNRNARLKLEEVERMGGDLAVRVWEARLEMRRAATSLSTAVVFKQDDEEAKEGSLDIPTLSAKVQDTFEQEIAQISRAGDQYVKYQRPAPATAPIGFLRGFKFRGGGRAAVSESKD